MAPFKSWKSSLGLRCVYLMGFLSRLLDHDIALPLSQLVGVDFSILDSRLMKKLMVKLENKFKKFELLLNS